MANPSTGEAPFLDGLADGPAGGTARWLTAADGVRIRVIAWGHDAPKGTVLLFPGRTEYAEKYGRAASELYARGYATLTVDWRGQGIADRLIPNRQVGHVGKFRDYQHDVQAMLAHAGDIGLPQPFYLLAHSMGGCIGLRALHDGLPVEAAAFTGPMWGIHMAPVMRPVAAGLTRLSHLFGFSNMLAPGQSLETYVKRQPFEGNTLTNNPEMFDWMRTHIEAKPELSLGGPSLHWLQEALAECQALRSMPSPDLPCVTFLGDAETIVDTARIHDRMSRWPKGELVMVENAQHEVMMEGPAIRDMTFDRLASLFQPA